MREYNFTWLIVVLEICFLVALLGAAAWLTNNPEFLQRLKGKEPVTSTTAATSSATTEPATEPSTQATTAATTAPVTEPATEETTVPVTEPVPQHFYLSFAGDCTLGTIHDFYTFDSCFPNTVGDDFEYPFAAVQEWFANDDFTMVNLEGPLTNEGTPAEKTYAFRGDPKFAQILPAGSVECVSLANNHTEDFGAIGYESTKAALDGVGVAYAGNGETILVETDRGLKIGILAVAFYIDHEEMAEKIVSLRDQGAQIVIVSFHWGNEGYFHHTYDQSWYAYAAIDAGADIIFGHHPHVLQAIEEYNGGIIYYSLGNFSFGGNDCPRDFDTALISQEVIVDVDGTVSLGECKAIPCSISPVDHVNRYQPTPAAEGSERYSRVMEKLDGTYSGPDVAPPEDTEEETEEETEETTEATEEAAEEE